MRPFPLGRHAGLDNERQAGSAETGFGPQAFTSGQRARWTLGGMVGRSPSMERLFLQMRYLAGHLRCALIEGERGTGKQLAARTLHELGPVRDRGFVTALADEFLSGANAAAGLEQARGGTLHLHSVDSLNHEQQGRLLHLLGWVQQQQAQGARAAMAPGAPSSAPRALLVSSRRALRPLVLYGKFRSDLQQQLSAVQLTLPPLRDRRDDIPMLVELFVARYAERYGKRMRGVAQDALQHLLHYPWPSNVGELEDVLSRAVLRAESECLQMRDLLLPARASEDTGLCERLAPVRPPSPEFPTMQRATLRPMAAPASLAAQVSVPIAPMQPQAVSARVFASARGSSHYAPSRLGMRPDMLDRTSLDARAETRFSAREPMLGRPSTLAGTPAQGGSLSLGRDPDQNAARHLHQPPDGTLDAPLDANLDRAIMRHIELVLRSAGGNKLRTARLLGISRSTLYRLLDAHAVTQGSLGRELPIGLAAGLAAGPSTGPSTDQRTDKPV